MSQENIALMPTEEKSIEFYGDELLAFLVEDEPFVPLKPICHYLSVSWSGQYERIKRDPVLSEATRFIRVTRINTAGGRPELFCLPLKFLSGWLFGINANRVKEELREKLIQYQKECYEVLAQAFQAPAVSSISSLTHIRDMALAIAQMAEQQMVLETRITTAEARLDKAAQVVGDIGRRLSKVESRLKPGAYVTDEQAAEISLQVKALAHLLGGHYQAVFSELYRKFGVSSYKFLRVEQCQSVLEFLEEWRAATVSQQAGEGN